MSDERYIVYWARLAKHDDPYNEGYVGISRNTLAQRKRSHYKAAKRNKETNNHFHNALIKYGKSVIWEVICDDLAEDDAFALEGDYRPQIGIGWNTDKGGVKAVSPEWYAHEANKQRHSQATAEATRRRIAEKDTPEARAARAREIWADEEYRKSREGISAGENNPHFGKFGKDHPAAGHTKTPEGLAAISAANKGKVMSRETRHKLSEARSKFTPEQRAEMYERRCSGDTPTQIAEYFDTNADAVDANIRRYWKTNKLSKPKPLDELNPGWRKYKKADEREEDETVEAIVKDTSETRSKFTPEQRSEMYKLRCEGEPPAKIAEDFDTNSNAVGANIRRHWETNKLPKPKSLDELNPDWRKHQKPDQAGEGEKVEADATDSSEAKSKFTAEQRAEIYRRRCAGETPKQIAKDYQTTAKTVDGIISNWWRDHKLPKPKPLDELNPDWRKYKKADEPNAYRGSNARASKFTHYEREDICERRAEGETYSSIGKSYGKGVSTIRNICQVWGPENGYPFLEINGEREQAFTKEQKAEICKRRTNGETFEAIAKGYNATFQNVHGICSVWGPKNGFPFTKTLDSNSTK